MNPPATSGVSLTRGAGDDGDDPAIGRRSRCSTCSVSELCVALGSDEETLRRIDELLTVRDPVPVADCVVRQGDPFRGLFAVRSGTFKSYIVDRDGREQVQGFHFAGELIGMEGISRGDYAANVVALEPGSVCTLRYSELLDVSACSHTLQRQLFNLFSRRIADEHWRSADVSASEQIAAFLLDISARLERRGQNPRSFDLTMSRRDIANYLGLATETVSRIFSRFRDDGLISVRRKHIELLMPERLRQVAISVLEAI